MAEHQRIEAYISAQRGKPFTWAENNCMSFVVDYLQRPELPAALFRGYDTPQDCFRAYAKAAREMNYAGLVDAFDALLRPEMTLHPRDGFVVGRPTASAFGHLFGLHWRNGNWFLTEETGLVPTLPQNDDLYWSVP